MVCLCIAAVFAALTSILAKAGIEGVNSNLMLLQYARQSSLLWHGHCFYYRVQKEISDITKKLVVFSTVGYCNLGLSWLCYYKALQTGDVSKVAPVDKFSVVITTDTCLFGTGKNRLRKQLSAVFS